MVVLDALYHLATETAVHINYAAVKFTVIFLVVFLVVYWVGKSLTDGIFTSISGPVIFYFYYIFANSTLNRAIFKIDENFGYIFVHIAALLISYFVIYEIWAGKKGAKLAKSMAFAFIIALCIFGLESGFRLAAIQLQTHNEEINARTLQFITSLYLVLLFFGLLFLSNYFIKNKKIEIIISGIGSGIIVYAIGQDIVRSIVGLVSAFALLNISKFYLSKTLGTGTNRVFEHARKFLYFQKSNKNFRHVKKINTKTKFSISAVAFGIVGSVFMFTPYKILKNVLHLGLGLRHNDHVMIGTIALIVGVVSLYRIIRTKR